MMSASKNDVEDFKFIIREAMRLTELINESYELYRSDFDNDMDLITAILHPPQDIADTNLNLRQILFSSKAQKKLQEIAIRQVKSKNLVTDITIDEFIICIRDELYLHLRNQGMVDMPGFSSLLSKASKRAKRNMHERTYFFPFNAPGLHHEKEIHIGPVKIINKDKVYSKVTTDRYYDLFVKSNNYDNFNCLLCIPIPKCSDKVSESRARNVADFVYGMLKVFTTSYYLDANELSLINNPTKNSITQYIACSNNHYWIEGSYLFGENLEDFWILFEKDLNTDLGSIIKKITEYALSPDHKECAADRLIDAFYWFGDAARDTNNSAQVVKLVTAMERIVTLSIEKKDKDLTKRFCSRVSSLVAVYYGEIDKWQTQSNKIYKLRSNLVHGSEGLYKSYDSKLNFDPFQLATPTILSACILFSKLGLDITSYEIKLQNLYLQLSEHCNDEKYKIQKVSVN